MATFNISLPEPLSQFVESRVAEAGYDSASEYIQALVHEDQMVQLGRGPSAGLLPNGKSAPFARLPDPPLLDECIPVPFDLPRPGKGERVQARTVPPRLPDSLDLESDPT